MKRTIKGLLAGALACTCLATTASAAPREAKVIEGSNRYETAVKVSQDGFTSSAAAVIVSGDSYADAISSLPLASKYDIPILLSSANSLPSTVVNELNRLGVEQVYIVGGPNTISAGVEEQLKGYGHSVVRLHGSSRYDTNKKVNDYVFTSKTTRTDVFIVNAFSFADILSIGPVAYAKQAPIILSDTDGVRLQVPFSNIGTSYVIGGTTTLTNAVVNKVPNPQRIYGSNRYATSATIDDKFFLGVDKVFIATGHTFADAITAIPLTNGQYPLRLVDQYASEVNDGRDKIIIGGVVVDDISASKNAVVYINPHQDDETLSMGTQLVRDINLGRDVYILQFTLGEATGTYDTINNKLKSQGYPTITRTELGEARTREMTAGLTELGVPAENIISYPYKQYEPTSIIVRNDINRFINSLSAPNIHFRVMHSGNQDGSAGSDDHIVVEHGLDLYMANPNSSKNYDIMKFLTMETTVQQPGYKKLTRTNKEDSMWNVMYNAYGLWSPAEKRYAVGGISARDSFEFHLKNRDGNQIMR